MQKGKVKGSSSENSGITRAKPGLCFSSVSQKHGWWLSNKCQYSNQTGWKMHENGPLRSIKWRLWRLTQIYWSPSSEGNSSMTHNLACPISRLADGRLWRKRLLLQRNQLSKKCGRQSATIAANNLEWHQWHQCNLIIMPISCQYRNRSWSPLHHITRYHHGSIVQLPLKQLPTSALQLSTKFVLLHFEASHWIVVSCPPA